MGAQIPHNVADSEVSEILMAAGMRRKHQGKVRDTFDVSEDLLMPVSTDRLSIFDFVLPAEVPLKGEILNAMTVFWLIRVLRNTDHHLVAFGGDIDQYLPYEIRMDKKNLNKIRKRAIVVKKFDMLPVECIARGYLTGSGWKAYQEDGAVCGHQLSAGLHDGSKLPKAIFTPTTKAAVGHDEHISAESVIKEYGAIDWLTLEIYSAIAEFASQKGVILADTKFEFGQNDKGDVILCDEVATPDSSRFWDKGEWEEASARGKSPSGYDKEPVRQWGKTVATPFTDSRENLIIGIHKLDNTDSEHIAFVSSLKIPREVLTATTGRYSTIFKLLTGQTLEQFQKEVMGIS